MAMLTILRIYDQISKKNGGFKWKNALDEVINRCVRIENVEYFFRFIPFFHMCRSIDFEERPAVAYTIEIIPKFIADELQDFVIDL